MLELTVDMEQKQADLIITSEDDKAIKEIIFSAIALTEKISELANMSFESSLVALAQLSKELYERAIEIEEEQADE